MKIPAQQFELLQGPLRLFANMKKEYTENEIAEIKKSHQKGWRDWKELMTKVLGQLGKGYEAETESWTNGWLIQKRFWTRIKRVERKDDATCNSVAMNGDSLRVHLEWHNNRSDRSGNSIEEHNAWINYVEKWVAEQSIDPADFKVWTSLEDEDEEYITLETYLQDEEIQAQYNQMVQSEENTWIRVGKVFTKEEVLTWDQAEEAIANVVRDLDNLYEKTKSAPKPKRKYWLFNVFYSKNSVVWEKSRAQGIAAMQYEEGRQSKSVVTKNLNIIEKMAPGDYVIAYTGSRGFLAIGEVTTPFYQEKDESKYIYADVKKDEGWRQRIGVNWFKVVEEPVMSNDPGLKNRLGVDPSTVMSSATIFEIPEEGYRFVKGLIEGTEEEIEVPQVTFKANKLPGHLYFEGEEELVTQVRTAMANGKHIILTGPPGTGKSKLAKYICDMFKADYKMSTATSDWSTYETIGGYRPNSDGTLSFSPGLFLECFKDETTSLPQNKWLIIDEMNRADIDKAFGSLFSALTGDPITLNFQTKSGRPLLLKPQKDEKTVVPNEWEYIIPKSWRLIGTMNTLDKASLYEMSYAFMRRFAFIPVGIPRDIDDQLVKNYLETWEIANFKYTDTLVSMWKYINEYRPIGPAIIEDIARYVKDEGDLTSAIILYVLPQFEGLLDKEILEFIQEVREVPEVEEDKLIQFAEDFFHIKG
ncbi:MoxR-like ATPase [Salimicrobium salexigens]|uniref:MoxR-like ATPase n=1 Tax=Salimicrobium salexigens TaxID=908941 RepID=A0ABY1KXW8_9BACI|nr:MoxR-like ATPase [Salimicrobium salexigens]